MYIFSRFFLTRKMNEIFFEFTKSENNYRFLCNLVLHSGFLLSFCWIVPKLTEEDIWQLDLLTKMVR